MEKSNRLEDMPSDLVSLADASSILGVSSERVRQLVVAGDLPAQRFGTRGPSRWMQSLLAGTRLGLVADRWGLFGRGASSLTVTSIWVGRVATSDEQRSCAARWVRPTSSHFLVRWER